MRIGINVPDRVLNRIKALDPEVNVSKMCREALEDCCAVLERARARVASDGVDEQVMRLSEGQLIEPDWVGYALDDARDWVNTTSPDKWARFFSLYDSLKSTGRDVAGSGRTYPFEVTQGFWKRISDKETSEWFEQQYDANPSFNAHAKAEDEHTRAWLGYVNEVRRKQLQHIDDEWKRVMAEREKAWAARPEPELPPQLRY